jgi:hypothetical protein
MFKSLQDLKNMFGSQDLKNVEQKADHFRGLQGMSNQAIGNQSLGGIGYSNQMGADYHQQALVEKYELLRQQAYKNSLKDAMEKFEEMVKKENAVSLDELQSPAYSMPLKEAKMLWRTAFGSKWVRQQDMEGMHRLLFNRFRANDCFERTSVSNHATMTFETWYQLKEE